MIWAQYHQQWSVIEMEGNQIAELFSNGSGGCGKSISKPEFPNWYCSINCEVLNNCDSVREWDLTTVYQFLPMVNDHLGWEYWYVSKFRELFEENKFHNAYSFDVQSVRETEDQFLHNVDIHKIPILRELPIERFSVTCFQIIFLNISIS